MILLGIETSCDETSVGIVENTEKGLIIKANEVATSLQLHSKTGGIIPEIAAREQVKYMLPVLQKALSHAFELSTSNFQLSSPPIDAIAVTYGPGLIGSLLVGVETAKTLSFLWNKPIIPVNHMLGHIYANWVIANNIEQTGEEEPFIVNHMPHAIPTFPALILVVSGGHTDLLLMKNHGEYEVIGGTRDDAAGEAFDKIARLLGLPYPGGPAIQDAAEKGNPKCIHFPRPLIGEDTFDFSFSGLKTAVYREVQRQPNTNDQRLSTQKINDLAAASQAAIIEVLIKKTIKAAEKYEVKSILLSGGVSANDMLRERLSQYAMRTMPHTKVFFPEKKLCTDNGAMIAAAAIYNYHPVPWQEITVNPQLYY